MEKRVIEISLLDEYCNKSEDEDYEKDGLRIKIKRLKVGEKHGSMGLIGNSMQNKLGQKRRGTSNQSGKHSNCTCNGNY